MGVSPVAGRENKDNFLLCHPGASTAPPECPDDVPRSVETCFMYTKRNFFLIEKLSRPCCESLQIFLTVLGGGSGERRKGGMGGVVHICLVPSFEIFLKFTSSLLRERPNPARLRYLHMASANFQREKINSRSKMLVHCKLCLYCTLLR